MYEAAVIIILFVLLLVLLSQKTEAFDTYWNHTMGAQKQYERSNDSDQKLVAYSPDQTELLAKYTWSERNPNGIQLYDKVYEMTLRDNSRNVVSDPTYADRDIESDHLDYKFSTLDDRTASLDSGSSTLTHYTTRGMAENPLYTIYNGEYITLSQKSF